MLRNFGWFLIIYRLKMTILSPVVKILYNSPLIDMCFVIPLQRPSLTRLAALTPKQVLLLPFAPQGPAGAPEEIPFVSSPVYRTQASTRLPLSSAQCHTFFKRHCRSTLL